MEPRILTITERKLIGIRIKTSLSEDRASELWQQFMPRRNEVQNRNDSEYYSVQIYDAGLTIDNFNEDVLFEKWAAVAVADFDHLPEGMDSLVLAGGKYAVFIHKGPASAFEKISSYIHRTWMPDSGYELDNRAHFEIMGDKYLGPNHPETEEDVWIPIKEPI